jgi:hypothetical protein
MGTVVSSTRILEELPLADVQEALKRHEHCDWGNVCKMDWDANNRSLVEGARLLSQYKASNGKIFWIMTEADRSRTTILLPDEF